MSWWEVLGRDYVGPLRPWRVVGGRVGVFKSRSHRLNLGGWKTERSTAELNCTMPAAEADPAAGQEGTPPPWWPKHACTASHLWCKPLESASSARRKSMTPRPGWEYRYVVQSANFLYIFKAEDADESSRSRRPLEAVCFEDLEYTQRALPDEEVRRRAEIGRASCRERV